MNSLSCCLMGVLVLNAGCQVVTLSDRNPEDTGTPAQTPTDSAGDSGSSTELPVDTGTAADTGREPSRDTVPVETDDSYDWYQLIQPAIGKCYGDEDGSLPGEDPGCYGIALASFCAEDYARCMSDEGCVAMEACDAACSPLRDEEWQNCSDNCRRTAAPAGLVYFDRYRYCIYCSACAWDCRADAADKGCIGGEPCPLVTTACYGDQPNGQPQCWGCAMINDCRIQVDDCSINPDCTALEACLEPCNAGPAHDWQSCTDTCRAAHPEGTTLLDAYHECVYCTAGCKQLCPADGPACL